MSKEEKAFIIIFGMLIGLIFAIVSNFVGSLNLMFSLIVAFVIALAYPMVLLFLVALQLCIKSWAFQRECTNWLDLDEGVYPLRVLLLVFLPIYIICSILFHLIYGIVNRSFGPIN